jgi:thioredoxin reductase (NADPH)
VESINYGRAMDLPVIVAVDNDPAVLGRTDLQLNQRYGASYRIECVGDAGAASRLLERLAEEDAEVAVVVSGRIAMAGDGAGGVLDLARRLHPVARRVLMVAPNAWVDADRADAIRAAMAVGRVDHFIFEPGPAPDEVFHESLSSFLLEWARERLLVPHTVHIVGDEWSGRSRELRDVLEQCAVPHRFVLAESERGRELLGGDGRDVQLPAMVLPDGSVLSDPSNAEIAIAAGAPPSVELRTVDLLVVGAGPAGLSAAVYAASDGLEVLVVDIGGIGGQIRSSSQIRNYLGFARGVSGSRLAEQAYEQASVFGARFVFLHRVTGFAANGDCFTVALEDGRHLGGRSVLIATGASYRRLGIEAIEQLSGAGVFYGGSMAEAPSFAGEHVYVVGGGNSAGQAALHLARYADRVTMIVRAGSLDAGMSQYLISAIESAPGISVRTRTEIVDGGGDGRLEWLMLRDSAGGEQRVGADGLFILIGAHPMTEWLPDEFERDDHGFLMTGEDVGDGWPLPERRPLSHETSVPGVFAAGDVRHGSVKRVAAAVGDGATAVQLVHRALDERMFRGGEASARARPAGLGL